MQNNESTKIGGEFHFITTLEKGQRYTVLVHGIFGAVAIRLTLEDVKVSEYAQYSESVLLIYKPKGKRNSKGMRFHGRETCVIWSGWVELDTNPFSAPTVTESGLVCKAGKYASCDSRFMTDAIASTTIQPIFSKLN